MVHFATLQKYLDLGLKITKVHRVLQFKQKPWMRLYIDKNTQLRTRAQSDFKKDFFKLMNNSVFGKMIENVRNRVSGFLLRDDVDAPEFKQLMKQSNYKSTTAFPECNLSFVEMYKTKMALDKPIYCGVSI